MDIYKNPIKTTTQVIACDGGDTSLGHPRIFLNLGKEGDVVCPYCSQYFVKVSPSKSKSRKRVS